jgi:hypothetical protein
MGGFGGVLLALVGIEIRSYRSFERFGRQFIQQARAPVTKVCAAFGGV